MEYLKKTNTENDYTDSYIVEDKNECPTYNTIGCEECDLHAHKLCLIGCDIRKEV